MMATVTPELGPRDEDGMDGDQVQRDHDGMSGYQRKKKAKRQQHRGTTGNFVEKNLSPNSSNNNNNRADHDSNVRKQLEEDLRMALDEAEELYEALEASRDEAMIAKKERDAFATENKKLRKRLQALEQDKADLQHDVKRMFEALQENQNGALALERRVYEAENGSEFVFAKALEAKELAKKAEWRALVAERKLKKTTEALAVAIAAKEQAERDVEELQIALEQDRKEAQLCNKLVSNNPRPETQAKAPRMRRLKQETQVVPKPKANKRVTWNLDNENFPRSPPSKLEDITLQMNDVSMNKNPKMNLPETTSVEPLPPKSTKAKRDPVPRWLANIEDWELKH